MIREYFSMQESTIDRILQKQPNFGYGQFSEAIFYSRYSHVKHDGKNEDWHDVVIRCINGIMSIRKNHYINNGIVWDEKHWQDYAIGMALSMVEMKWTPPGRGLWKMGTDFIAQRGAMALYNCAFTKLGGNERLGNDLHWLMDCLMLGCGVGFEPIRDNLKIYQPQGSYKFIIGDSREAWCDSVKLLIECYLRPGRALPVFDYSHIRPAGLPIRGFGGTTSGPDSLRRLHEQITHTLNEHTSPVRIKTDLANLIGCMVIAGNVRRSAELAQGSIKDVEFANLKNYKLYPERESYGYMSNNTVNLIDHEDFNLLGEVARRVIVRGEPGVANQLNFPKGRLNGRDECDLDLGTGLNPCGEIILEDKEVCNIVMTIPTRCKDAAEWYQMCRYATFYASTVALLPTHRPETNKVIAKNRRIGVAISGVVEWIENSSMHQVIRQLRTGYKIVRETNKEFAAEAGVPASIRVTTIKPDGTVVKVIGVGSGASYPTFDYTLMRITMPADSKVTQLFKAANIPYERSVFDPDNTLLFQFPVHQKGRRTADIISIWEQANIVTMLQREWSDNSVSNTIYFKPKWQLHRVIDQQAEVEAYIAQHGLSFEAQEVINGKTKIEVFLEKWPLPGAHTVQIKIYRYDPRHEENIIELVLSSITPLIKSASLLPHSAKGVYRQMPQEGISQSEYQRRVAQIKSIDWSQLNVEAVNTDKYCTTTGCARE